MTIDLKLNPNFMCLQRTVIEPNPYNG